MRRFLPAAVFLAVAVASLFMAGTAYFASEQAARFKFEAIADDALARIDVRIDQHVALLRAALAFMQATDGLATDQQFATFVGTLELERRFAGIRGMGYARLVPVAEEATANAELRGFYGEGAVIWPPETDQDWRTPIMFLSPLDERNKSALGFDMFSEPARRAAMQEAMASGEARATIPVALVQSATPAEVRGFLVYLPFYGPPSQDGERDGGLVPAGFLYASFRIDDLFAAALVRGPRLPVHYDVFDGGPEQNRPVFRSDVEAAASFGDDYVIRRDINVAGRPWSVVFQPSEAFEKPVSQAIAFALGIIGLLLAAVAGLLTRSQAQAYDAVAQLHQATEKSLLDKDLMLREMNHRIKNSIARVMAIARHTASGSKSMEEFSSSFAARLQAMAASQDMLTRSSRQKGDLRELLRIELGQVFGSDLPEDILSGPPVMLSETATQALGLTFHELATNALKYGEAGESVGALKVGWATGDAGRRLHIRWVETGKKPVAPSSHTGFGTRLIDMNIRHELGGTLERTFRDGGLTVDIEIPLQDAVREAAPSPAD